MSQDSETKRLLSVASLPKASHNDGMDKKRTMSRWTPTCWYIDCFPYIKARFVLSSMLFLGLCNVYALRVNLSVAIVSMTSKNPSNNQRHFDWSNTEQGWVLSSFFYGYLFTQIPGGWIATRFGGKHVFGIGVLVTSVLTLITPQMADINIWALVTVRVVIGFFEGVTFPAMISMFGVWAPPLERSIMSTIALSGPYVGNIIAFPLSGVLCDTIGWPYVFYCFGSAGIIWYIAWLLLVFNTPADHPRISPKEQHYIEAAIKEEIEKKQGDTSAKDLSPPWRHILMSPAVIAIAITNFCNNWGFYTLLTCLPTFLSQTLCLNIAKNGVYSAIPYMCMAFMALLWGQVTDRLRQYKITSTTAIRKINNMLGLTLPAVFLLLCGYFGNSVEWAILFLSLSVGCSGFAVAGFPVNNLDISPKYAGILLGISNMIGTIPGFLGPQIAKLIAKKPPIESCGNSCEDPFTIDIYRQEWQLVFIIAAEVYAFGAVAYLILGSGKKQPWADGFTTTSKENRLQICAQSCN